MFAPRLTMVCAALAFVVIPTMACSSASSPPSRDPIDGAIDALGEAEVGDATTDDAVETADDSAIAADCPAPWPGPIETSPECIALCRRINRACPGLPLPCEPKNVCKSDPSTCVAARRAQFQCSVDTGTITCYTSPPGWGYHDECSSFSELCDSCP